MTRATKRDQEERGLPAVRITIAAADMVEARATWARFLRMNGESDRDG